MTNDTATRVAEVIVRHPTMAPATAGDYLTQTELDRINWPASQQAFHAALSRALASRYHGAKITLVGRRVNRSTEIEVHMEMDCERLPSVDEVKAVDMEASAIKDLLNYVGTQTSLWYRPIRAQG